MHQGVYASPSDALAGRRSVPLRSWWIHDSKVSHLWERRSKLPSGERLGSGAVNKKRASEILVIIWGFWRTAAELRIALDVKAALPDALTRRITELYGNSKNKFLAAMRGPMHKARQDGLMPEHIISGSAPPASGDLPRAAAEDEDGEEDGEEEAEAGAEAEAERAAAGTAAEKAEERSESEEEEDRSSATLPQPQPSRKRYRSQPAAKRARAARAGDGATAAPSAGRRTARDRMRGEFAAAELRSKKPAGFSAGLSGGSFMDSMQHAAAGRRGGGVSSDE